MIRVALADDHEIVRTGFKMILEKDPAIQIVGEAADGPAAYALAKREKPDIMLLDLSMPPEQSGLTTCEEISRDCPTTKVIILTMFMEPEYLYYTLRNGARGYLIKNAKPNELLAAIHTVYEGGSYVHPSMAEVFAKFVSEGSDNGLNALQKLTPRELEILQLLARGYTNREISEQVYLSVKTIEAHRSKIYSKLGLKSRAELVDFAIKHKLLDL